MPGKIAAEVPAFADKDVARTFAESEVTVSSGAIGASDESLSLGNSGGTTFANESNISGRTKAGIRIIPNYRITALNLTRHESANADFRDGYEVQRLSDDTTVDSGSLTVSPGDTFEITGLDLSPGTEYSVYLRDSDGVYTGKDLDAATSVPEFDVTGGINQYGNTPDVLAFSEVIATVAPNSGSAYVEWPAPNDVFGWDVATFTASPDGESVEVYVEEYRDGEWTEIAGPIDRGGSIKAADPDNNVRFRVDLERSDGSNDPTLDSIARRWKL